MRSLGGFVLLAGIGVGLFVYLPAPVDSGTSLDHVQRVAATRAAELPLTKFTPVSRLRIIFARDRFDDDATPRHAQLRQGRAQGRSDARIDTRSRRVARAVRLADGRRCGDTGCMCRPLTQTSVSANSVTLVLKATAVFAGEPSC